jgi:hypothetical protein
MDEPIPDISEIDQKNALALAIVKPGNIYVTNEFLHYSLSEYKNKRRRSGSNNSAATSSKMVHITLTFPLFDHLSETKLTFPLFYHYLSETKLLPYLYSIISLKLN